MRIVSIVRIEVSLPASSAVHVGAAIGKQNSLKR